MDTREQILLACRALFAPGQVAELRIMGFDGRAKTKAVGWFNDWHMLARYALEYEPRSPEGTYVTLNALHPAILARTNNTLTLGSDTATAAHDVIRRHWLPIDIDPAGRPKGISSSDAELEAARTLAARVATWLENDLQFPPGLRAHSGNGVHLLYRLDLPNDDAARDLVKNCLVTLNDRYGSDGLKIDLANSDAGRIWKLYGTVARKGAHTAERPHRRSRLWPTANAYPAFPELGIISPAQLEGLAALRRPSASAPPKKYATAAGKASKKRGRKPAGDTEAYFDLDGWIRDNGIAVAHEEPWDGTGKRYVLEHCLFDPSHAGSSAALGRTPDGHLFYKCQHDSCAARRWADAKALFAPAGTHRRNGDGDGRLPDDPWQLARHMLDEELTDGDTGQVLLRRHREVFYKYSSTKRCYVAQSDDTINMRATRWLGDRIDKVTRVRVRDMVNCLAAMVTVPAEIEIPFVSKVDAESGCTKGDPARYNRVALKNGILDVDAIMDGGALDDCLHPHTPEWFDVSALPFPFPTREEQLETPTWLRFLSEIFERDQSRIDLLQEAFGYCFFPTTILETFFVFHGQGRNGKSTVLSVLRDLLGESNVSALSPEQLADRFLVGRLHGKLANICADMNEVDSVQEGVIKAAVTGDLITSDRKYKEAMQFRCRAKLFFSTNVLPRFTDTSLGVWRRMRMVPFKYVCPLDKVDPHLFAKLEKELPGIFLWALQGTRRLVENRTFGASKVCGDAARDYRLKCFPILMFLEECTASHEADGRPLTVTAGDLWNAYCRWGQACGLKKPKPIHAFVSDVCGFQPHIQYVRPQKSLETRLLLHGIGIVQEPDTARGAETPRQTTWYGT